jgi:hypothetical protein
VAGYQVPSSVLFFPWPEMKWLWLLFCPALTGRLVLSLCHCELGRDMMLSWQSACIEMLLQVGNLVAVAAANSP